LLKNLLTSKEFVDKVFGTGAGNFEDISVSIPYASGSQSTNFEVTEKEHALGTTQESSHTRRPIGIEANELKHFFLLMT
jgi:hypothetical protein